MSGGTLEPYYESFRIGEVAESVREHAEGKPLREIFAATIERIATAVNALDRSLSGDSGPDDADEAIRACFTDADWQQYVAMTVPNSGKADA